MMIWPNNGLRERSGDIFLAESGLRKSWQYIKEREIGLKKERMEVREG